MKRLIGACSLSFSFPFKHSPHDFGMVEFSFFSLPDMNSVHGQLPLQIESVDLRDTKGTIARWRARRIKEAMHGLATRPRREKKAHWLYVWSGIVLSYKLHSSPTRGGPNIREEANFELSFLAMVGVLTPIVLGSSIIYCHVDLKDADLLP